jgi:hypothetical protein
VADADRFWSKVERGPGCWIWVGTCDRRGYGAFYFYERPRRQVAAHRFVWELHHGPIPAGMQVCHACDTPPCCNPDHLWLGTAKDNSDDKIRKGRTRYVFSYGERHGSHTHPESRARGERSGARTHPESIRRGSKNGQAALTEAAVLAIRERYATGTVQQAALAREFGISVPAVSEVINHRKWRHVGGPVPARRIRVNA